MTFAQWLKGCNDTDPLAETVYICNDYLNAERILENASGENTVIRLERYTAADHAKHIIETSCDYMNSRILVLLNAEGCEIIRRIIEEGGISYFKSDDRNACMEIFMTISELRMNGISPDELIWDSRRINGLKDIFTSYESKLLDSELYDNAKLISAACGLIKSGKADVSGVHFAYDKEIEADKLTAEYIGLLPDPAAIDTMADMSDEQYQQGLKKIAQKAELWRNYGVTNEVERTVLHIVNSGYEFCDTAVLCPDDEYMDLFMSVCDYYKVPVEFPEGISCRHTDIAAFFRAMLKWCKNDYRFDLFRDVMLSPVFSYEEKTEDDKTKSKGVIFLEAQNSGNGWGIEWYGTRGSNVFKDFYEVFKNDEVSAKEFYGGVLNLVKNYVRAVNAEQGNSLSSVKDALVGRYRFYADYNKHLSLQEAMSEMTDLAENARYSLPAPKGAVTCCLMGQYSALFEKNIYVLGLTAGRFPAVQDESPVLNDSERENLFGNREHCSDATERRKLTDLVRTVLMAERANLVVSCSIYDTAEIRAQSPSAVYTVIAAEKGADIDKIEVYDYLSDRHKVSVRSEMSANKAFLSKAESIVLHEDGAKQSQSLTEYLDKKRESRIEQLREMCEEKHFTISATSLKNMLQCPLRFFYERIAHVEKPQEVDIDRSAWLKSNGKGMYIHEIMEDYAKAVLKGKSADEVSETVDKAVLDEIFESVTNKYLRDYPPVDMAVAHSERDEYYICITTYLDALHGDIHSGKREVVEVECPFCGDVEINDYKVTIRGRIDRLDKIIDGANVSYQIVDYKTGDIKDFRKKLPEDPQDYIYALALENGLTPVGAVSRSDITAADYVFILEGKDCHVAGSGDNANTNKMITKTFDNIVEKGFKKCYVKKNDKNSPCKYCPAYQEVCSGGCNRMSEEQIRNYIIDKDSYNKNILVEAGAGAGKTRLIIQRVIGQIGAGIPVEKIVLITFTNAAANELYERIQAGLTENIAKSSGEEKKLYENAVMNLQCMKICTIHSFCLSMLSEQPFEADLHLGLKLTEDVETKQAQADFFERYYRNHGANIDDFGFLNNNQYKLQDSRVKNFLLDTFLECAEYRDVEFVRDKSYDSVTFDRVNKHAYSEMCNYKDSLVRAFYNGALGGKYEDIAGFLVGDVTKFFPDNMNVYDPEYNYVKVCASLKACKKLYEPFNKTKIKKDHPKCNENMAIFSPSGFENVKKENALYALNKMVIYTERAVKAYQADSDGDSVSNDGLLYHTHELLKNSSEARAFFKNKYSCIYIDEFQDTDVMQTELLLYLCADDSKLTAGGDIWQCPLRDGALFAVGDPKQSIYGFRDADIRLYNKMKAKFQNKSEKNCEFFSLDYNFRSDEQLIAWVNEKFQPKINGKYGMTYSNMISKADKPATVSDDVIRGAYFVKEPGAESVAKIISDLVKVGRIFDKVVERPIRYSDFLLLLWNTTQMEFYSRILTDRGIPYTMWGKRPQVNSLVLKRFIALAEFVFESYSLTAKEKAYSILWDCVPTDIDFEGSVMDVDDYAESCESNDAMLLAVKASADTADEPMAKLYKILDFPELLFKGVSNGEYELSNLIYLLEKWKKQDFAGSGELMDMMKNELSVLKEKELILDSSEQNCVRLMNLHKAKGLEGNIVIMAEAKNPKFSGGKYTDLVEKKQVFVPIKTGEYTYLDYLSYYPDEKKQAEDKYFGEQLRLEYVAATRAKQAFIFVYALDQWGRLAIDDLTISKIGKELPQIKNAPAPSAVQAAHINVRDIFDEVSENRSAYDENVEKLSEKFVSKITPSHLEDGAKVTIPNDVETISYERPSGRDIGHMVHHAFELAVNMRENLFPYTETTQQRELVQKIVSRAYLDFEDECSTQTSEDVYKDYIDYQLHSFLKDSEIEALLNSAQAVYTELPFYSMDGNEYSNGVMDLVLKMSDKRFIIIDYKTNIQKEADRMLFEERICKKYKSQLDFYEKILRKMLSLSEDTKVECHIYFMNDDKYMKN